VSDVADERPLWERQPWDTKSSFAAFQLWLLQDERPRSLDAAYRLHVGRECYASGTKIRASDTWRRWYQARDKDGQRLPDSKTWEERAAAYDEHLAAQERRKWEARRRQVREQDWDVGDELRDLAANILAQSPQFLKTTRRLIKGQDGAPDREVVTLALDGGFLLRAVKLASELQRQAAEVLPPVQRHAVEITKTEPISFVRVGRPASEETDGEPDSSDDD
jgi:hypothetical protein